MVLPAFLFSELVLKLSIKDGSTRRYRTIRQDVSQAARFSYSTLMGPLLLFQPDDQRHRLLTGECHGALIGAIGRAGLGGAVGDRELRDFGG